VTASIHDEPATRREIIIGPLHETVEAAIGVLAELEVFQRSGALVDVVHDGEARDGVIRPEGAPRVRLLPPARLRECLDIGAEWKKWTKNKDGEPQLVCVRPPLDVVSAVEARGQWAGVRLLDGAISWPVLRPDGRVLVAHGYDAATRLMCEPSVDVSVPEFPTREDAQYAVESLRELVADSPFASPAHLSAWLAALLSVIARPAIDGPVPLTLIDANTRGAGKTTLANLIGVIVTGRELPRRAVPDDSAEWRKTLLAIAIAADPVLLIDNVTRMLASDAFEGVLTGTTFRERLLGRNEELCLPIRTVFIVTANNATISADLVRRSLHVRLESPEEQPERRASWQHPDVIGHAREHRERLLRDALTILRAYVVAGRPPVGLVPMGSYEAWSAVVRAPLVWAGMPDPAETQEGLREGADVERDAITELLRAWRAKYGDSKLTTAQVLAAVDRETADGPTLALRHAVLGYCDAGGKLPSVRKLGNALRKMRGRVIGGRWLTHGAKGQHGAAWQVLSTVKADSADSTDSTDHPSRVNSGCDHMDGSSKHSQHSQQSQVDLSLGVTE
jgi:hypothetical protein